jgi:hypothetical protein
MPTYGFVCSLYTQKHCIRKIHYVFWSFDTHFKQSSLRLNACFDHILADISEHAQSGGSEDLQRRLWQFLFDMFEPSNTVNTGFNNAHITHDTRIKMQLIWNDAPIDILFDVFNTRSYIRLLQSIIDGRSSYDRWIKGTFPTGRYDSTLWHHSPN